MSLHSWEYLEAVTGSPPRTKKLRHYLQSDSDVMCCKYPKTSQRPQKPRQGDQLIHRRYTKSSPQYSQTSRFVSVPGQNPERSSLTYIHTYMHTYKHTYIHAYIHPSIIHPSIHPLIHSSIQSFIHSFIQIHSSITHVQHTAMYMYTSFSILVSFPITSLNSTLFHPNNYSPPVRHLGLYYIYFNRQKLPHPSVCRPVCLPAHLDPLPPCLSVGFTESL